MKFSLVLNKPWIHFEDDVWSALKREVQKSLGPFYDWTCADRNHMIASICRNQTRNDSTADRRERKADNVRNNTAMAHNTLINVDNTDDGDSSSALSGTDTTKNCSSYSVATSESNKVCDNTVPSTQVQSFASTREPSVHSEIIHDATTIPVMIALVINPSKTPEEHWLRVNIPSTYYSYDKFMSLILKYFDSNKPNHLLLYKPVGKEHESLDEEKPVEFEDQFNSLLSCSTEHNAISIPQVTCRYVFNEEDHQV
ncbi:hypothetical protein EDC01DRAFT_635806 [Geopyxis carbonaria]|nr:hypothetical protein EDC01DRAFT_635806 [Geopyxis carbonaria]